MMRDNLKDKEYFKDFLKTNSELINFNKASALSGKMSETEVERAYFRNVSFSIQSVIAQYSIGDNLSEMRNSIHSIIETIPELWSSECSKITGNDGNKLDRYMVSPYERFLNILSLAYLLEVSDLDFQILVDIIDRDNISDNLYEFIVKARFPERQQQRPEAYDTEHSVILKVYDKLRSATKQDDKKEASKLVKQFLDKGFYHAHMNLYNSHKSISNTYCGYWSFEAAAVVKIMGLDDSSFIDHKYYPKDLVHQNPEEPKKGFFKKLGF